MLLAPIGLLTGATDALLRVAALGVALLMAGRAVSLALLRHLRRRGVLLEPTVILGGGTTGAEIARVLSEDRSYGATPVGFVGSVAGKFPLPVLGDINELDSIISRYEVRRVIVAFGRVRDADVVKALRSAVKHDLEVNIVPRFFDCGIASEEPDTDDVRGIPLYRVRRAALRAPTWMFKRVLDLLIASAVLAITAPIVGLLALAVKFSSTGPVLFRQRRVGQAGREFVMLKFRTLRQNDASDTQWSVIGDGRVTPIGRFLRRTSLDELPQLWNVLRGDMSLVGPRPERPFFAARFGAEVDGYDTRHRVPSDSPGPPRSVACAATLRSKRCARCDNYYIENWSMWRDFVILGSTAAEVVRGARGPDR